MSLTFGHVVFSKIYGALWRVARPVLRRNRRLADGFGHRLVPADWAQPADIWLQAASGGEAYLVWELLKALPLPAAGEKLEPEDSPAGLRVLVTTWTRQGLEVLQGMTAALREERPDLTVQTALFPLDAPNAMYRAVRMVSPRLVVLLETELWPGLLFACTRCKVPVAVLNGRMTPKSVRGYALLGALVPGLWRAVAPCAVGAISRADADRFARLFDMPDVKNTKTEDPASASRVRVIPNIKFDRAAPAFDEAAAQRNGLDQLLDAGERVLLASVREEEEGDLLRVIIRLREQNPERSIIVAPRHMHRSAAWATSLHAADVPFIPRSLLTPEKPAPAGSVIVWDAFGELSSLYALVNAVFVGGSLAPLGGQNFLEALAHGVIPCVGPHTENFSWVLETCGDDSLYTRGLLVVCRNADILAASLTGQLNNPVPREAVRKRFQAWLEPRLGGARQSADVMLESGGFSPPHPPQGA